MPDVAGLFDSFLEAAVSLAVLFVIVAWVSSKIVELGQLGLNMHGRVLRDELERCFGEEGGGTPGRFTRYFYWHPMIVPLTQPSCPVTRLREMLTFGWWRRLPDDGEDDGPAGVDRCYPPGRLPAHIAPETFAAVVMNPFPWPTTAEPLRRLLDANLESWLAPERDPDPERWSDGVEEPEPGNRAEAVRRLADLLVRKVRSVHPNETWNELLARREIAREKRLGAFQLVPEFGEARVDPAGTAADEAELLFYLLRSEAKAASPDDRLREMALAIVRDRPVSPESWKAVFTRLGIHEADSFEADFLRRSAKLPASDPADRYFDACSRNRLVPHELETRVVTLLRDADGDLEEFRAGLKRWYAEAMERVTGRFKRSALLMLFGVALIICAAFNLNAFTIIDGLIGNPELRGLGVQASRAIGDSPRGMAVLSQKLQFQQLAEKCAPEKPDSSTPACEPHQVLTALWADHSQPVIFADEKLFPSALPAATNLKSRQREQVVEVRNQCANVNGLCSPTFTATLNRCHAGRNSPGVPQAPPAPAATAEAPAQAKAVPAAATGSDDGDEACARAWSAVWRNPDFFWHPETAHKFASDLWGGARLGPADGQALVRNLNEQARADTDAVRKYIEMLPSVGWIEGPQRWKELRENPLWVIFGILLSAALAALGAPFWYDVLGKISGRAGARSRGEKA